MKRALIAVVFLGLSFAAACGSDDEDGGSKTPSDAGSDAKKDAPVDSKADAPTDSPPLDGTTPNQKLILPKTALAPEEIGILVNSTDPVSVEVGDYYQAQRKIPAANVVKLALPAGAVLSEADFATAKSAVDAALPASVQALVVTWTQPYRVDCMSVTSAFALGFDKKHCNTTGGSCGSTAAVESFDSATVAPYTDLGIRPTMMLAAKSAADAKALVDRGVAADATFPTGDGYLIRTTDTARSVRWQEFVSLTQSWTHPEVLKLTYIDNSDGSGSNVIANTTNVLFYFTGLADVPEIATNTYRPGAIADHLTSSGGEVPTSGQMSVVAWLEAGATASFGTVVEPCNFTSKFPDPRIVLKNYYRGATLLEAYWKSVQTPGEGLFVGEPLATPWGTQSVNFADGKLVIKTTILDPAKTYALESATSEAGPFTKVKGGIAISYEQLAEITLENATAPVYRLVVEG